MTEVIPQHTLAAAGRALKFQILAVLNTSLANSGVTVETLSTRLGWSRRRVTGVLKGHVSPSLREIGELFWAIDGSVPEFAMVPRNE